jgi:hypothetical protein
VSSKATLDRIDRAIAKIESETQLHERATLLSVLRAARAQYQRSGGVEDLRLPHVEHGPDDYALSLVQSAMAHAVTPPRRVSGFDLWGRNVQYEDTDIRWISALIHYLSAEKVAFPTHDPNNENAGVIDLPARFTIAMAGDWGTGNPSSLKIAAEMAAKECDYSIHLGDVYYAGLPDEELQKFVLPWPKGSRGSFALNSNHEMYAGGTGYFDVALKHAKFAAQAGVSYFAMKNDFWTIIGLDSAYHAHSFLYQKGQLDAAQLEFLHRHGHDALENGRQLVLLTHHNAFASDGRAALDPIVPHITNALCQGNVYWYWGHEHGAIVFKPRKLQTANGPLLVHGRCIGHGGVPYAPLPENSSLEWCEREKANDPQEDRRALNGFALLTFNGDKLSEQFFAETGRLRWHRDA